jgi:hypothetical protein
MQTLACDSVHAFAKISQRLFADIHCAMVAPRAAPFDILRNDSPSDFRHHELTTLSAR